MVSKNPGGRPKKEREPLVKTPSAFPIDEEFELTEMQAAFVWHYTEGACGQTEAARRAGFSYPASAATKMLNGKSFKNVTRAVRIKQDELREKYAITPEAGHYNAAVSAIKELNQLAGLNIHRSQNLNINANIDAMSKDDIKQRLNQLLGAKTDYDPKDF